MFGKSLDTPVLCMALTTVAWLLGCANQEPAASPAVRTGTTTKESSTVKIEKATFGAGCFWGVELEFSKVPGVIATAVGYCGGKTKDPTYKEVCNDATGHAEVVQIEFDPVKVGYQELVDVFFELHDPTTLNRQGPDVGSQYRSVIFVHSPEQERIARETLARLAKSGAFRDPIVTKIEPAQPFYSAEDYHQKYFEKKGIQSCHIRRKRA